MIKVLTLNEISKKIYDVLDAQYSVSNNLDNPNSILVRSYNMLDYPINKELKAVARAGAGVNNIPLDKMTANNVVVFNTPGANANAVKELVICGMFLSCRDILGGITWSNNLTGDDVPKQVEKGKSKFGGIEIFGKTAGIIGLGAIGVLVANALVGLGLNVIGYDPYLTETAKKQLHASIKVSTLDEIFKNSDFITLHIPLIEGTKNIINENAISLFKNGVTVLNFSRDGLVNIDALKAGINEGKVRNYVVDLPTLELLNCKNIIALPHLGASTEEAEDNCAIMASSQIKDFFENGNIINSVNFPNIKKARNHSHRLCITYNTSVIDFASIKALFNEIADVEFANATKNTVGYAIVDSDNCLCDIIGSLESTLGIKSVVKIKK